MRPLPPSEGLLQRGGRQQGRGAGKGGASPSFSERAQSWSQKSRRRDIQTEPRCVWQEERERGREGAGGGEERGRKERGAGENREGASVSKSVLSEPRRDSGQHGGVGPGAGLAAGDGRGRWALAHRDSRTPQLARPGRTQAEAKINVRRADRGRPVGGPNTHPHLATQRASVHAGPGARVGPTAGPPWPPDLMGSLEEASLLPDTSLAAMVGTSQGAKRPREARERGPCGETHIDGHRDKPRTHNAMGTIPVGARIDTGMSTQTGRHAR